MRRGVVLQQPENLITELPIKGWRLERVTVEPYSTAAACPSVSLGRLNQLAAVTLAAQVPPHPDKLDLQPSSLRQAVESSDDATLLIAQIQCEWAEVTSASAHHVVLIDLVLEKLHVLAARLICEFHRRSHTAGGIQPPSARSTMAAAANARSSRHGAAAI